MSDLTRRVLIVTGAASGIGKAAALRFASFGARIVLADVNGDAGQQTCDWINDQAGEALFIQTDVSKEADAKALVEGAVKRFGRLDGAFNNAGIEQSIRKLHEIESEQWNRVLSVNLSGVFFCLKHQIPAMIAGGGGSIVNTASSLGQVAIPYAAEYVAAKHGVVGLTRAAAVDYAGQNIRVNAVLPGMTQTPMIERGPVVPALMAMFSRIQASVPMERLGQADEIAQAAAWLLSDASSFVTGAILPVDGGYLAM
jgi:NAD(P)-dependent dehydrogenase (short-subunit alcohol dehydrogenase family)